MLKILGRATSSNVQAVMWAIAEMGLEHHRYDVGGEFGGTQTPEFLEINPMGRVPLIDDGKVKLFESQAILRYLAAAHKSEFLWPADPTKRAPIDQWMEWAKVNVYPIFTYKIFWQLVRTSALERDHQSITGGAVELEKLMGIAETQINRFGWLAGPEMTLADISFGTQLYRYFNVDFNRANLPNLKAYYEKLCTRPAYAEHVMVSFDSLRVESA